MSSKDGSLTIRIPIEIVPESQDIQAEIKNRIKKGREEERQRGGAWDREEEGLGSIYSEDSYKSRSASYPRSRDYVQPGRGAPKDMDSSGFKSPEEKMNRYAKGKAPYIPEHGATGENVPLNTQMKATGSTPLSAEVFKQIKIKRGSKVPNPDDVGLHIYEPQGGGMLENMLSKAMGGPAKAQGIMRNLKNPFGMVKGVLTNPAMAPILVGIIAVELGMKLVEELTRRGGLYDRSFRNYVDTRIDALRTRELQMEHYMGLEGLSQLITTTDAGTTSPRYAYNTHDEKTRQEALDSDKFGIRNAQGVE